MLLSRSRLLMGSLLVWALCVGGVFLGRAALGGGLYQSSLPIFFRLALRDDWLALWGLGAVWMVALLLAPRVSPARVTALLERIDRHIVAIALACFGVFAALAFFAEQRFPLSMDEFSIFYQSQVFAAGHLDGRIAPNLMSWALPPQFVPEFWSIDAKRGLVAASYWPGTALLMTPWSWAGAAWLFNPALSALTVWVFHRAARDWTGRAQTASWATLLLLGSPVFALGAATFYAMPAHLLFNVAFSWALWRALQDQSSAKFAFVAGVIGGFALVLHNPVPHFCFALPWWIYLMRRRRDLLLPLALGYLVFALPLGVGWFAHLKSLDAGRPELGLLARLPRIFVLPSAELLVLRALALVKIVAWATPGLLALAWCGLRARRNANGAAEIITKNDANGNANSNADADSGVGERANSGVNRGASAGTNANENRRFDTGANGEVNADTSVNSDAQTAANGAIESAKRDADARAVVVNLLKWSLVSLLVAYCFISYSQGHGWGYRFVHPAWFVFPLGAALALERVADARVWMVAAVLSMVLLLPLRAWQIHDFVAAQQRQLPRVAAGPSVMFVDADSGYYSVDLVRNDPFGRDGQWRFVGRDGAHNAALARQILGDNARQTQRGAWGELWTSAAN